MRWTYYLLLILIALLAGCRQWRIPNHAFGETIPASPVYEAASSWACLPDRKDACDTVPIALLSDEQASATIDVFFLYPTLFKEKKAWNAAIDDADLQDKLAETTLRHQASVFNGTAKVYVPYYRQLTYYGFWGHEPDKKQALQLALSDATAAFTYYMAHYNQGRPYIIAGHSQGAWLVHQLVEKVLPSNPAWKEQLVAAYAVGWAIPPEKLTALPVCTTATQTGCLVSWNTFAWGHMPKAREWNVADPICVNPLSWQADTAYAPYTLNKGGVGRKFNAIVPALTDAQVNSGYLWIHKDNLPGTTKWLTNYHIADYNLFWMNVRENAAERARQFEIANE